MHDFLEFMKSPQNRIISEEQNTNYYTDADGSQMAFGHVVPIEFRRSIFMSSMNIWFVSVAKYTVIMNDKAGLFTMIISLSRLK